MALENAESLSDPFPSSDTREREPDSSPLRVSQNTLFESGIPPARQRHELNLESGLERLETVLAEVGRSEINLGLLVRGLKHLGSSALAAREANDELMQELDALRDQLARRSEEERAAQVRTSHLERMLEVIRNETERERAFLIEQQDLFLTEILTDHDRQISELRRALGEPSEPANESERIAELIAQRDQAREYATRCERERDQAWHELAIGESTPAVTMRKPTPPPMPSDDTLPTIVPPPSGPNASAQPIAAIALRPAPLPAGYSVSGDEVIE